jgi:outer membrane protein assembly factor BamD (BamD/ComL family)
MKKLIAIAALIAATAAEARPIHRRQGPRVTVDVSPHDPAPRRAARSHARRPLSSERYLDAVARTRGARDSMMRRLAELLARTPRTNPERPEILFRLAEAHAARMRFARMRGLELAGRAAAARGADRARLLGRRRALAARERSAAREAIALFAELAGDGAYVRYDEMDRALFFYADTLRRAGRGELALDVLRRLIRRYPRSRLVGHAYFTFAEHHFAARELSTADRFYKAVLDLPRLSIHDYALYKRGWVQLNLDNHAAALEMFFDVARRSKPGSPLHRQATREFARTYAEIGKPRRALAAFRRIDEPRALDLLEVLGRHYLDRGQYARAIYTLRELLRLRPRAAEVCEWQLLIQDAMLRVGTKAEVVAETVVLIDLYRALRRRGEKALAECAAETARVAGRLAKVWHVEYSKTHDDATAARAAAVYRAYLSAFTVGAAQMRFYLGDLLWTRAERAGDAGEARRRWREAAATFDAVVAMKRAPLRLAREAAYAAVLGWLNALRLDPRSAPPDPGDGAPRPRPIRGDHAALVAALERYAARVPARRADAQRIDIEFLWARTLWRHDHLDEALPRLRRHVAAHPRHRLLIRSKRVAELGREARAMAANRALVAGRPELVERLARVAVIAARQGAEALEVAGRWIDCGEAYLEIARAYPGAERRDEVLYNGGVCFERARSIGYAILMFRKLRADHPGSELAERALIRLGRASSGIAEYRSAARYYEEYAREYAGEKDAAAALSDAVTYRRALGDDRAAIRDIEYFVDTFGRRQPGEASAALFGLAAIHERAGDRGAMVRTLERYLRRFASGDRIDRRIAAHAWLGEIAWRRSCKSPLPDGMCAAVSREPSDSAAAVCGGIARPRVAAIARDRRLVARARRHLDRALELAAGNAPTIARLERDRRARVSHWTGTARFLLAEAELEAFVAIEIPALDFDPRRPSRLARSRRAFAGWMRQAIAAGERADRSFRAILGGDNAGWAIAAAARMGQIPAIIADGIYRLGVPGHIARDPELTDRYCAELDREAGPLEERAVTALSFCLRESTSRGAATRWSELCERELERLRPRQHPADRERRGEPDRVAPILDDGGVIAELR